MNQSHQMNSSQIEMAFDINAEVEPVNQASNFVIDYGDMDNNDFEELNEDERTAIDRCRGLKRTPVVIEDMQPVENASALEYSYRPLDHIGQFWAGPSHWKFRRTTKSLGSRQSQAISENLPNKIAASKKKKSRKIFNELSPIDFVAYKSSHVSKRYKLKFVKLSIQTMSKKWDSRKLKLPTDFKIESEIFNKFKYAPNFRPVSTETTLTPDEDNEYNYDNDNDRNYCTRAEVKDMFFLMF